MKKEISQKKKPVLNVSTLELNMLELNVEDEVAQLAADDRRKALQILEEFVSKSLNHTITDALLEIRLSRDLHDSYRNLWPISHNLATSWRHWIWRLYEGGFNPIVAVAWLTDELLSRTRSEDPDSGIEGAGSR